MDVKRAIDMIRGQAIGLLMSQIDGRGRKLCVATMVAVGLGAKQAAIVGKSQMGTGRGVGHRRMVGQSFSHAVAQSYGRAVIRSRSRAVGWLASQIAGPCL